MYRDYLEYVLVVLKDYANSLWDYNLKLKKNG
jgi:hypothetical protein